MLEKMGLGVHLDLEDEMTSEIDPAIRGMDRLERKARSTTAKVDKYNQNMADSFQSNYKRSKENLEDMYAQMKGMSYVLPRMEKRMDRATTAMNSFNTATNRYQGLISYNKALRETTRLQTQLARMGYGASSQQQKMMDAKDYRMMNYQIKDLHDRIKLTDSAIKQMQKSPDSSKFRKEIDSAKKSLQEYKKELNSVQADQAHYARLTGSTARARNGGREELIRRGGIGSRMQNRVSGVFSMDMLASSQMVERSLDKTKESLVGVGNTALDAQRKVQRLKGQLMQLGMMGAIGITIPVALAGAGMALLGNTQEKGERFIQARNATSVSNQQMDSRRGFRNQHTDTWVNTGVASEEIGKTMGYAQSRYGSMLDVGEIQQLTEASSMFGKTWGVDVNDAMNTVMGTSSRLGVDMTQAFDMYQVALEKTNGNHEEAIDYLKEHGNQVRNLTEETEKGANAYEKMNDAMGRGAIFHAMRALRQFGAMFYEIFKAVEPLFVRIASAMYDMAKSATEFLRNNEGWAKLIGYAGLALGTFLALVPVISLLTGGMLMLHPIIQGISASLFGLSKGGLALISPQARMAKDRMDALRTSIARFPQTLLSVIPLFYTLIRGFPSFLAGIVKANPVFYGFLGLLALAQANFAGLGDAFKSAKDIIVGAWGDITEAYENSTLPETLSELRKRVFAFYDGFVDGAKTAIRTGLEFVQRILDPIKDVLEKIEPLAVSIFNTISKAFGGDGSAKSFDDILGKVDSWREVGRYAGAITTSILALTALRKLGGFILSPFKRLNDVLTNTKRSLGDITQNMKNMGRNSVGVAGGVAGGIGSVVGGAGRGASRVKETVSNGASVLSERGRGMINSITGIPGMLGFRPSNRATEKRAEMRSKGLAMTSSGVSTSKMREGRTIADRRNLSSQISSQGTYKGQRIFRENQNPLMRAMFGQKTSYFDPSYDKNGKLTGHTKKQFMRTGGLFNPKSNDAKILDRSRGKGIAQQMKRVVDVTGKTATKWFKPIHSSFVDTFRNIARNSQIANGLSQTALTTRAGATMMGSSAIARAKQSRLLNNPVTRGIGTAGGFVGRQSGRAMRATGRGLGKAGSFAGDRLQRAGFSSVAPFMAPVKGNTRTRRAVSRAGNIARGTGSVARAGAGTVGRGMGALASGAGMMAMGAGRGVAKGARGVGKGVRGAGRMATAPVRGAGKAVGGLASMLLGPWGMLLGGAGLGAYALSKGKDGERDSGNISKNIDSATESISGGKGAEGMSGFFDTMLQTVGDVGGSITNLLITAVQEFAKAVPSIVSSLWSSVKSMSMSAWTYIQGDGKSKMNQFFSWIQNTALPNTVSWLREKFGQAWTWISTQGMTYLNQFFTWLTQTAIPNAFTWITTKLGQAWNWVSTKGMTYLGQFLTWLIEVAIPNAANWILQKLGLAWQWVRDKGTVLLGQFFNWLIGTAIPNLANFIFTALGNAWNWVTTKGVELFLSFIGWLIGTAIPNLAQGIWTLLGKAWKWVKDDGVKYFNQFKTWLIETAIPQWTESLVSGIGSAWDSIKEAGIAGFNAFWTWIKETLAPGVAGTLLEVIGGAIGGLARRILGLGEDLDGAEKRANNLEQSVKNPPKKHLPGTGGSPRKSSNVSPGPGGYQTYAQGGLINRPHMGLVGEDGAEMIIPLTKKKRGMDLWRQAGEMLGAEPYAKGGLVGNTLFNNGGNPSLVQKSGDGGTSVQSFVQPKKGNVTKNNDSSKGGNSGGDVNLYEGAVQMNFEVPENATEQDAREHAQRTLEELKRMIKEERLKGNRNVNLEDLVNSM